MSANAFKRLMEASKKIGDNSPSPKRIKNNWAKEGSSKDITKKHYWKSGLSQAIMDVENIVASSDTVVIIKDKYPKAKFHYLVIPKVEQLNSARELTRSHINLLKEMQEKAKGLVKDRHPETKFKIGFHAKPSMDHLHLHVVSTDFVSTCLKTKKHWNSFNTEHFLDLPELISKLEENGNLVCYYPTDKDIELYLKKALKCNQCSLEAKTMPNLKQHLNAHAQSSSKM
ncbi:aprataxin-like isoform X2 [Daphnia carinata]|uniref:aprataxin-like isoform X2 n=1 Tax=Daphnia carinata TaxID=120202 RepID=UPI00257B99D3|nr:aprataxin-like isoform X2 [Daphnia carinata]